MLDSIHAYASVGLIHFMAYPQCIKGEGPILETLASVCHDDYFDLVEVTWMKDAEVRKEARRMMEASGMKCAFGAQPVLLTQKLSLNDPDENGRLKAISEIKAAIDQAYELGAVGFAFLSGKDPGLETRAEAMERLFDSTCEICEYAEEQGDMPVLVETFDRVEYGKNSVLGPTSEAARFVENVRCLYPNFGMMVDLSHMPLLNESPMKMLTAAQDTLMHVHIGNCVMRDPTHPAYGDEHPRMGIEGGEVGVVELAEFLEALMKTGYLDGETPRPMSFEVKPVAAFGEKSEEVIAASKRALNRAWAMI